jgi:hypothetical protein
MSYQILANMQDVSGPLQNARGLPQGDTEWLNNVQNLNIANATICSKRQSCSTFFNTVVR